MTGNASVAQRPVTGEGTAMGGISARRGERPYQRRRRGPVLVVVAVLAIAAATTWTVVFNNVGGPAGREACPAPTASPPPGSPPPGEVLPSDALDGVAPVPPAAVTMRVFNAGGQRGQANLVAAQLADNGFPKPEAANDPFFPTGDMECTGQLRFGPAGQAAASTVALVLPCIELVRDGRTGETVDVAVGTAFGDVNPGRAVQEALDQLAGPSGGTDGSGNADPAADPDAPVAAAPVPTVDPAVLEEARKASC